MSQDKDPNQGEGDRVSARRYDTHVQEFVGEGRVAEAAKDARGPKRTTVDDIVSKGHSVVERVRPMVDRALESLRARFGRK